MGVKKTQNFSSPLVVLPYPPKGPPFCISGPPKGSSWYPFFEAQRLLELVELLKGGRQVEHPQRVADSWGLVRGGGACKTTLTAWGMSCFAHNETFV